MVSTLARRPGADPATRGDSRTPASSAGAAKIELTGVTKRFVSPTGSLNTAIRDVDLVIEPGQFCAIVGPTGCGKSTTLSLVSGLARPSGGSVRVGGQEVGGIATPITLVFLLLVVLMVMFLSDGCKAYCSEGTGYISCRSGDKTCNFRTPDLRWHFCGS